jgi:hypothetical protein
LNAAKASLADNASLLGGKAEGDLSVAFADVARGLDETTMGAIKKLIPATDSSGKAIAGELSNELWNKIKELIQDGKGTEVRIGYYTSSKKDIFIPFLIWSDGGNDNPFPFPNKCIAYEILNIRTIQGNNPISASWSAQATKEGISFSIAPSAPDYKLEYIAIGY